MLIEALHEYDREYPRRPFLIYKKEVYTAKDVLQAASNWAAHLRSKSARKIGCYINDGPQLFGILAACSGLDVSVIVLNRDSSIVSTQHLMEEHSLDVLISDDEDLISLGGKIISVFEALPKGDVKPLTSLKEARNVKGTLNVMTSGTTGQPKTISYTWPDLAAQIPVAKSSKVKKWVLAYKMSHYAGLNMFMHALLNRDTLVLSESSGVYDIWKTALDNKITHISCSPTFWRMQLAQGRLSAKLDSLEHITLGSEIVSERLLRSLIEEYPDVSISQVYASTELGSLISVKDKRPGLPLSVFEHHSHQRDYIFKIEDSELIYKKVTGNDFQWIATGDLVEVRNDRVHFLGRKSEMINVGGVKIYPQRLEALIAALPGVKLVKISGHSNPIMGQVVKADIVPNLGYVETEIAKEVRDVCSSLGRHAVPKLVKFHEALKMNNMKLSRSKAS